MLTKLCRICGNLRGKDTVLLLNHTEGLLDTLFLKIAEDDCNIHPQKMCMKC